MCPTGQMQKVACPMQTLIFALFIASCMSSAITAVPLEAKVSHEKAPVIHAAQMPGRSLGATQHLSLLQGAKAQLERANQAVSQAKSEVELERRAYHKLEANMVHSAETSATEARDLKHQRDSLGSDLQYATAELHDLKDQRKSLGQDLLSATTEVHKLRGERRKLVADLTEAKDAAHAAIERTKTLNASIAILQAERNRVLADDAKLRKDEGELKILEQQESQSLLELRAKNHEFSQQADRLKRVAETENRALQVQMEKLNSQVEVAEASKAKLRVLSAENQEKTAKAAEIHALLLVETQKKTMMENEIRSLRAESQKEAAEIDSLRIQNKKDAIEISALAHQNTSAAAEIRALSAQNQKEVAKEIALEAERRELLANKEKMAAKDAQVLALFQQQNQKYRTEHEKNIAIQAELNALREKTKEMAVKEAQVHELLRATKEKEAAMESQVQMLSAKNEKEHEIETQTRALLLSENKNKVALEAELHTLSVENEKERAKKTAMDAEISALHAEKDQFAAKETEARAKLDSESERMAETVRTLRNRVSMLQTQQKAKLSQLAAQKNAEVNQLREQIVEAHRSTGAEARAKRLSSLFRTADSEDSSLFQTQRSAAVPAKRHTSSLLQMPARAQALEPREPLSALGKADQILAEDEMEHKQVMEFLDEDN